MAKREHVKQIKLGVQEWNAWRRNNSSITPDLTRLNLSGEVLGGADLSHTKLTDAVLDGADLEGANLLFAELDNASLIGSDLTRASLTSASLIGTRLTVATLNGAIMTNANLSRANITSARLREADLSGANLLEADLTDADLDRALLTGSHLCRADLLRASLIDTIFRRCNLDEANLTGVTLLETAFTNVDLSKVIGLDACNHMGPSSIDNRTLAISGDLPLNFLRGIGLPDNLIGYLPSLFNRAIQHYSCFISYSTDDQEFSDRMYSDLQNAGVRCWFAPHDMPIGGKILDEIDAAIRLRDKVLLILSNQSIRSDWVGDEVTRAFEEERKRGRTVLFPVRIDDAILNTEEAWAAKLRARHIGDFRDWKNHDAYRRSFDRALRDLVMPPK
jgi:uncharacterized protein YjbI with pentapeptide repeats